MTETIEPVATLLHVADLVPLRRVLASDSVVIRVNSDGTFERSEPAPLFLFERPIREMLKPDAVDEFDEACRRAVNSSHSVAYRPSKSFADKVIINPVVDDEGACRFLFCWGRFVGTKPSEAQRYQWHELLVDDVTTKFRMHTDHGAAVIQAAPWWVLPDGELLELWPHHQHVSAVGLGHAVMEVLTIDAAEAAAGHGGGPAVRINIPSGEVLAGLVPVVHGAIRSTGIAPERLVLAVETELDADPDLLPILVHLRTMGVRIDVVGRDALVANLRMLSGGYDQDAVTAPIVESEARQWAESFTAAVSSTR